MKNILVICTGNICRSPLIAAILENEFEKSQLGDTYCVSSAGTFAETGNPANEYSTAAAQSLGLDITQHRARQLSQEIVSATDLILCVTRAHKDFAIKNFPDVAEKCLCLSDCLSEECEIADPYGYPLESYLEIADQIGKKAPNILQFIQHFFTKISIGCDHNGYQLANDIIQCLHGYKMIIHLPSGPEERVDYPDYAWVVAEDVFHGRADFGILICKSGIGMSIAANKHIGIRAALCITPELAEITRLHNDANILCLGSMSVSNKIVHKIVTLFLSTKFEHGRHSARIEKISNFEKNQYNLS